ncbi:expressed unknown protein [Seminavis robusta]|uniref:Glucose receptor Git3-like N-terminal domain-containing protein n=1 Tax=Seminavis robusta TaxID=568900 RepID=A0A9N8HVV0_9STRA|nr:expressed unknown protein [Seminavis robusta]|eukprot:Sro2061_g312970.1 n/a (423) ;mRNA; f:7993-9347
MSDPWKQKWIVISFKIGSFLSIISTAYVMFEVASNQKKRSRTYFRLLFGLSLMEFLESIAIFCGPWCTPEWWSAKMWSASGNEATCQAQGFLTQIGSVGSFMYSLCLAVYYILAIRNNVVERKIRKNSEPWMHATTLLMSFVPSIAFLASDFYRPMGTICYMGKTPPKCKESYKFGYTTCTQGDNTTLFYYIFRATPAGAAYFTTALCLILVWWKIRAQEKRNVRYSVGQTTPLVDRKLSKRFAVQASLFIVVLYFCNIWSIINYNLKMWTGKGNIYVSMTASLIKPLEGFFNTMIYLRPRWVNSRKEAATCRRKNNTSLTDPDASVPPSSLSLRRALSRSLRNLMAGAHNVTGSDDDDDNVGTVVDDVPETKPGESNGDMGITTVPEDLVDGEEAEEESMAMPERFEILQDAQEQTELEAY